MRYRYIPLPGHASQVGALVEALVGVAEDHRGNDSLFDKSRRLCESLVFVLNKGGGLLAPVRRSYL